MRTLLVSTYELGHQPLNLASPAAALAAAGHEVRCVDLAVEELDPAAVDWADVVAFSVPMHTATRLAVQAAAVIRGRRPELPLCAYGLYAGAAPGFDAALAGEYEPALVDWVGRGGGPVAARVELGRHHPAVPRREGLPELSRYARLLPDGTGAEGGVLAGYAEASHGCVHRCRHCPVPVVYDGRIRTVPVETVMADVDRQVEMGARHITFGDPDFLNGPHHARRMARAFHQRHPDLTFDVTTKVEHVLRHRDLLAELAASGLLFVVSAFESVDDRVLERLAKGHTAADAATATELLRAHGIEVRPSLLPFTPWTTVAGVVDLLDFVISHDLVANVDPVQYSIRLLLPPGSLLLDDPEVGAVLGPYDPVALSHPWRSPHPGVDELQAELAQVVEAGGEADAVDVFPEIHAVVARRAAALGRPGPRPLPPRGPGRRAPRLSEAWFCCAEPTKVQLATAGGRGHP
ncbi:MAG TPA: CUAEP/CCAEP-tail radical SAM protein [Acidimicrobiales bacterium]|nr:CUAEP/CCAEP-tail radical SAM protein [Acidimicrobiales bacterium]